jgi:predicted amidohydrolase
MSGQGKFLKIACWQVGSFRADVEKNIEALEHQAAAARANGADLLITPEMFITGYNIGERLNTLARTNPLERLGEIADRHEIAIVAGGPELVINGEGHEHIANAAWVVDDQGETLSRHHKMQLYGDLDRRHFQQGDKPFTITEYRGFSVATLVCFDVEFPETVRAAALAGADFVAVPTAQMEPFGFVNDHLISTRAWENSLYIAYVNQIGQDGELEYVGNSVVSDPFGRQLIRGSKDSEELLFATIDAEVLTQAREQNQYLSELRKNFY